jgi:hypothetical protein
MGSVRSGKNIPVYKKDDVGSQSDEGAAAEFLDAEIQASQPTNINVRITSNTRTRSPQEQNAIDPRAGSILMNSPKERYPPPVVIGDPIERAFVERSKTGSITYAVKNAETATIEPIVFQLALK